MICKLTALAALAALVAAVPAQADVVISPVATQNMSCSGGVCAPTATNAVLNVTDLENLLASGNVTVTTTGTGVQANDVEVDAPLTWSSASTLRLDAYLSITVNKRVSVAGLSGIALTTNDGGTGGMLSFRKPGSVKIANLASQLVIDGSTYTLAASIETLANDIAADPGGNFALASDYDASPDGRYRAPPIATQFLGNFQGLGNSISHLRVRNGSLQLGAGLFSAIYGSVENLNLRHVGIRGKKQFENGGGLRLITRALCMVFMSLMVGSPAGRTICLVASSGEMAAR